jgi:hypothetical protein
MFRLSVCVATNPGHAFVRLDWDPHFSIMINKIVKALLASLLAGGAAYRLEPALR